MLLESAGIDKPNTTSFSDIANRRTRQQSSAESLKLRSLETAIETKPQKQQPSDRAGSACGKSPSGAKKQSESLSKALNAGRASGEFATSGAKETVAQLPKESKRFPALGTLSNIVASPSSHNRPTSKLAHYSVNLDKKIRRQIRAIQKAIKQESRRGSTKSNSGILRGLKKSLRELNAARIRSDQTLLSKPYNFQDPISSPESQTHTEKSACQELIQRAVPLAPHPPGTEPEESQAPSNAVATIEKSLPSLTAQVSQQPPTGPEVTGAGISTTEQENTMAHGATNGARSQGKRSLASADHHITDADTDEDEYFPLTKDCHHYTRRADVDWDIQKYWDQRYSIFSLYDEGIHMTDDAWFGVTPEPVADKVARDLAALTPQSKTVLIDIFAGAGGNVIAFALSKRWSTIIAIEKDPSVIACAQHNAAIYGVYEQITWVNGDSFSYLESKSSSIDSSKTVIFASPPWGGPGYNTDKVFNLNTMSPYPIKQIHDACKEMDSALYLPRSSDLRQIAKLAPEEKKIEVVQYCMQGASKALVAYIPAAAPSTP